VLGVNSSTSRWVDVLDMAQANDIEILNIKKEVVTDEFIENMDKYKKQSGKTSAGKNIYLKERTVRIDTDKRKYPNSLHK